MRQQGALKNIGWKKVNGLWYRYRAVIRRWMLAEKQE